MIVHVIRHGAAEASNPGGDPERRLTAEGIERMKHVAKALEKAGAAPKVILTSPLVRARETAEIAAKALECGTEDCAQLAPSHSADDVIEALAGRKESEIALVGHEPQLGNMVGLMVTGIARQVVDMKKAAATRIDFDGPPRRAGGVIVWHLIPAVVEGMKGK